MSGKGQKDKDSDEEPTSTLGFYSRGLHRSLKQLLDSGHDILKVLATHSTISTHIMNI